MADEGPNYPGTVATQSVSPEDDQDWSDPDNVKADDGSIAGVDASAGTIISYQLKATNFGFSLPVGATIDGIVVEIERHEVHAGADVTDYRVQLLYSTLIGDNKASASEWPTSPAVETYGGASDTWGATLNRNMINSSLFGVVLSVNATSAPGTPEAQVDFIRMTVYYSVGLQTITMTSLIATGEAIHAPVVAGPVTMQLIATGASINAPQLDFTLYPTAVATEEAIHAPQVNLSLALLAAIATGEAIYAPSLGMWIEPGNIATAEAIYEAIVAGPISADYIATTEVLYAPQLNLKVEMVAIATEEDVKQPQINFTIFSAQIPTGEAIYEPIVAGPIIMAAIPTSEAIYEPQINLTIFPLRIETEEAVYAPDVILAIFAPAGLEYIVELHDSSGDLVAVLERASSIAWTRTINEAPLLSFVMPADDSKIASISRNDEIWLRNYYTGEVLGKFLIYLEKDSR